MSDRPWLADVPSDVQDMATVAAEVDAELRRAEAWKARSGRKQTWRSLGSLENLKKANAAKRRRRASADAWNDGLLS